jgi:soluble cytochrome b562
MKIRNLLASLICALAITAGLQAADEPKTPLGEKMGAISRADRALNTALNAGNAADALKQATIIRESAEAVLTLDPVKKNDLPAAEQAKFVADYQRDMKIFIADAIKLEAALKAGNIDEAKALRATLKKEQTAGHKAYKKS